MESKECYSERIEKIMNQLSESVLGLSDDGILAEVTAEGHDPQQEAKRVRNALEKPLDALNNVNLSLSNLGHAVNSSNWNRGPLAYHNTCLHCGLSVSFTIATAEIRGSAVQRACRTSGLVTRQTGTLW
jgi:hypothetical protein